MCVCVCECKIKIMYYGSGAEHTLLVVGPGMLLSPRKHIMYIVKLEVNVVLGWLHGYGCALSLLTITFYVRAVNKNGVLNYTT